MSSSLARPLLSCGRCLPIAAQRSQHSPARPPRQAAREQPPRLAVVEDRASSGASSRMRSRARRAERGLGGSATVRSIALTSLSAAIVEQRILPRYATQRVWRRARRSRARARRQRTSERTHLPPVSRLTWVRVMIRLAFVSVSRGSGMIARVGISCRSWGWVVVRAGCLTRCRALPVAVRLACARARVTG